MPFVSPPLDKSEGDEIAAGADVYVDEPYLSIRWDAVHNHVHSEWKAFANSVELRAGLLSGIKAIRAHRAVAYVSDSRKLRVIVPGDQAWIRSKWMPLALEAGLRRIAFVTAPSGLGRLNVEDVAGSVAGSGLESCTFESMAEARKWVSQAPAHQS